MEILLEMSLTRRKCILLLFSCSLLVLYAFPTTSLAFAQINADVRLFVSEQSSPLFADCGLTVNANVGKPTLGGGLTANQSANSVLTDNDTRTKIAGKAVFEISFSDGGIINGPGDDVIVYETTRPEAFRMSVFDPLKNNYSSTYRVVPVPIGTNDTCPKNVNAAGIDFSRFGIPENSKISLIFVDNLGASTNTSGADIADIVPVTNHSGVSSLLSSSPSPSSQPTTNGSGPTLSQNLIKSPLCPWFYSCQ